MLRNKRGQKRATATRTWKRWLRRSSSGGGGEKPPSASSGCPPPPVLPPRRRRRGSYLDPVPIREDASPSEDDRDLCDLRATYCWLATTYTADGGGSIARSPKGVQAMFEFYLGNNEILLRLARRGRLSPGRGPPFGHRPCGRCERPPASVWPFSDSRVWLMGVGRGDSGYDEDWDCHVSTAHIARNFCSEWEFLKVGKGEEEEEEAEVDEEEMDRLLEESEEEKERDGGREDEDKDAAVERDENDNVKLKTRSDKASKKKVSRKKKKRTKIIRRIT